MRPAGLALALAVAVVAGIAAWALLPRPAPSESALGSTGTEVLSGPVPVPVDGAYFGTHFSRSTSRETLLLELEADIDRRMAIDHVYHGWDAPFPNDYDRATIKEGRLLFLSWSSRRPPQPNARWSDIAAGRYDRLIDQRARAVARLDTPVLLSFDHEPLAQVGTESWDSGSVEDFVAAFRHVVDRFERAGTDNVAWVWTLTSFQFRTGDPERLYPGDDVVDWVGVDGYVNIGCPWLDVGWRTWTEVFEAPHDFAAAKAKPLVVAEFGLREDPADPTRKQQWFVDSIEEIRAMPSLKAVVSFNSEADCSSYVLSSPQAREGYATMGADPWFSATPPKPDRSR